MDKIAGIAKWALENGPMLLASLLLVIAAAAGLFTALAGLFLLIPGPHPEDWFGKAAAALNKVRDFLGRFSRKPAE